MFMRGMILLLGLTMIRVAWASEPCSHCQENPLCLGTCGYELLIKAETAVERLKAQVVLGRAWVLGNFDEGARSLLSEALREAPPTETELLAEARYWLAQAHHRLSSDSTEYYYKLIREEPATPAYWRAKANLALSALIRERNPARARVYASEALELAKQAQHTELEALSLNQLAVLEADSRQYERALRHAEASLRLAQSLPKPRLLSTILTNLASIYDDMGRPQQALTCYQEALQIAPDTLSQAHALINLANHYYYQKKTIEAEKTLNKITQILSKLPFTIRKSYYQLRFYIALDRKALSEASRFFEAMAVEASKALQEVETSRMAQLEQLSGLRRREDELRRLELSRSRERLFYGVAGALALAALGGIGYAYRAARRRAQEEIAFRHEIETLNQTLRSQSQELERQNQELVRISEVLSETVQDIQDSINAAERLQKALIPPLTKIFPGASAHYQPLRQVGGDFFTVVADSLNERYLLAVGDATGHGVSGSILASIFGATIQNFFLQNPRQSAQILLMRVHAFVSSFLASQDAGGNPIREGCDVAILIFDIRQQKVNIGLAGRPVWIWDPQTALEELEGGRRGLDSFTPLDYEFPNYEIPLTPQKIFYLFSDGVTDVLNPEVRKWGAKRLRQLIQELNQQRLTAPEQRDRILKAIQEWRTHAPPNDDITLLIIPGESILAKAKTQTPPK